MLDMAKIRNFFFCLKYPFWKSYNRLTGKFSGYEFTEYDFIPEGWRIAFGKQLSKDIKKAGKASRKRLHKYLSWKELITILEIKEKYGQLRIYAHNTEEIQEVLDKYELLSLGYCINCGKPVKFVTKDGWVEYLCFDCFINNYLNKVVEDYKLQEYDRCRLKPKDIPDIERLDKNDNFVPVDLKEEYGIDFYELWNLPH